LEEVECAFGWCCLKDLGEQDLMELFGKIWIQNVGDFLIFFL
jgi:hypothetical protein